MQRRSTEGAGCQWLLVCMMSDPKDLDNSGVALELLKYQLGEVQPKPVSRRHKKTG